MDYLRHDVSVVPSTHFVGLRFGYWSLDLPRDWVSSTDGLSAFLAREAPLSSVDVRSAEASNVAGLLRIAGCLTVEDRPQYTLAEVRTLFVPLCISWHARYYGHPLWARLREGRASRNALVAWILHTYHLSQSAGVTAARCVACSTRPDVKRLFLESAIEEYSHCRDYYGLADPRLGLPSDAVRCLVPSAANLAFDQQMFRLAEEDWLAHVLVGYFQESTASYYDDCASFYDEVARRYALPGFFEGWKAHMRLDLDYGHASAFGDALASDEEVSGARVRASLANAALTVQWLVRALDAIDRDERDDAVVVTRRELATDGGDTAANAMFGRHGSAPDLRALARARTARELVDMVNEAGLVPGSAPPFLTPDRQAFVAAELGASCCRALSFASSEAQLLALGRLTERSARAQRAKVDSAVWCAPDAIAAAAMNFLREAAARPGEFATALLLTLEWLRTDSADAAALDGEFLGQARRLADDTPVDARETGRLATRLMQLCELWHEPESAAAAAIAVDVIR